MSCPQPLQRALCVVQVKALVDWGEPAISIEGDVVEERE